MSVPSLLEADLTKPASHTKPVSTGFGTVDLTDQSGYPNHAPQAIEAFNGGVANENLVCTTWNNVALTVPVPPGQVRPLPTAIKSLAASGADISVLAFYWMVSGSTINP